MGLIDSLDLAVKLSDASAQTRQQLNRELNAQIAGPQQGRIGGCGHGLADLLQSLLNPLFTAAVVLVKEPAQRFRRSLLQLRQFGPALEQVSYQGCGHIVEPYEHLREDLFEPIDEDLQLAGMLIDQFAALLDEELQAAGLNRIRLQTAEPLGMLDQIVQDEIGVAGISLGPGRADAQAVMGQLGGVQGEQVQMG